MRRKMPMIMAAGLLITAGLLVAGFNRPFAWWPINDMAEQVSIQPFNPDSLRTPPEGSVAVEQWDPVPNRMEIDQIGGYDNPIELTDASIKEGKALFDIYCVICHGKNMSIDPQNMTPVQKKGMMGLPASVANMRSDGYLYATITNGSGGLMPRQAFNLSPEERWHVINYIRSLK